tara:strand:- start:543 stop:1751 length:1209 start_codon:yes stop_codon:yes gene_type:complete
MKFKDELKIVGFQYFISLVFWIAFGIMAAYWVLYFADIGLSFTQIGLIFIASSIAMFLFEIPTGAIADTFGRKVSVGLSYLIVGSAFFAMLISGANFWILICFNFIAGIGWTMESGAFEAWFVDSVKHKKKSKHLHHLMGRWRSMGSVGFIIGPFIGAILIGYGYDKALLATSLLTICLGITILIFGKEIYFKKQKTHIKENIKKSINNAKFAINYAKKHSTIILLTIISFLFLLGTTIVYSSYQPHVVNMGIQPSYIGYALSIAGILMAIQLNYSKKIKDFFGGNKRSLIVISSLFVLAGITIGLAKYLPLLFIAMILYAGFYDMAGNQAPAFREILNKVIPSKHRASILSVVALAGSIGFILGDLSFGLISDHLGPQTGVLTGAGVLILTVLLYFKLPKN